MCRSGRQLYANSKVASRTIVAFRGADQQVVHTCRACEQDVVHMIFPQQSALECTSLYWSVVIYPLYSLAGALALSQNLKQRTKTTFQKVKDKEGQVYREKN